jgi:glycogen phosphorylase
MKFMMNGALTIGTRDGATIEMAQEVGHENVFLFGLTAEQVESSRGWYTPRWHYQNDPEVRAALDLIGSDHFSRRGPGICHDVGSALRGKRGRLTHGPKIRLDDRRAGATGAISRIAAFSGPPRG